MGGKHPELSPIYLQPRSNRTRLASFENRAYDAMKQVQDVEKKSTLQKSSYAKTIVDTKITSTVFNLSSKVDIPSDNAFHKINIMSNPYKTYFRYSAVPKLSTYAYLKAKITNNSDYPLLKGGTNIYLDNSFITKSTIDTTIATGESFWVFLGADEGIKIKYKKINIFDKEEGFINKDKITSYEYLTTITNNKKDKIELVLWDQLPISKNKKIEVALQEPKYSKDNKNLKINKHKFIKWIIKLNPKQKIKIPLKYTITSPNDMNIMTTR